MSGTFVMSSRQAAELDHALERCGWTAADVKKLSSGDLLARILPVVRGEATVTQGHIINCDTDPFIPEGWKGVEFHRKHGQLIWQPEKAGLWLSPEQQCGGTIVGNDLRGQVKTQPVLNACVLDYLLKHPNLIPESWKRKLVFFWGTIYRDRNGRLCVRCLDWSGDGRNWYCGLLDGHWGISNPAVVLCE